MLPSFLQKVEVVSEASRETCVALSDCLNLFTKQEGVGSVDLNFLTIVCMSYTGSSSKSLLSECPKIGEDSLNLNKGNENFILHQNLAYLFLIKQDDCEITSVHGI